MIGELPGGREAWAPSCEIWRSLAKFGGVRRTQGNIHQNPPSLSPEFRRRSPHIFRSGPTIASPNRGSLRTLFGSQGLTSTLQPFPGKNLRIQEKNGVYKPFRPWRAFGDVTVGPAKNSENLSKPLKNLWKPSLPETLSERQISSQRLSVLLPPPCRPLNSLRNKALFGAILLCRGATLTRRGTQTCSPCGGQEEQEPPWGPKAH